ncbi:hypothetical protein HPP92_004338 [Vanilla planifolia]|uniref:RNA polymerase II C-terminal domain phosphatase-like n=1 Tax=Vanilla planifolia TaxID=51239 RepID=A0A835VAA6_VANPL|nr:hypothetical protein HPP92_004338 [Vanilla planifolia]
MLLAEESPVHSSSSSDDFAALLEAELELGSSDFCPNDDIADNAWESDVEELRNKRIKVDSGDSGDLHESAKVVTVKEFEGSTSNLQGEGRCPPHPGFFGGMCVRCAEPEEENESAVAFGYIHKGLKLGSREIDRLREADLKNLLREKKLILILDLDHTLLNSTRLVDATDEEQYLLREAESVNVLHDHQRSLFKLDSMHIITKLRPFVHTFLKEARSIFEMYVYTMAERSYALEVVKLLDPEKKYFNSKVISQNDSTQRHQKGLDVVLGAESIVVILDDSEFVWHKHKENLILMERYHFFASSCRQFGFNAKSLSELKQDESESDGALATTLSVLKRAHQMFFDPALDMDLSCRDLRQILGTIRRGVLGGCRIVFSRLFPSKSKPEDELMWRIAEQLGAICLKEVDASVTHVVSTDAGTQKSHWARQNDKFLVNPGWIEASKFMWRRQPEKNFPVYRPRESQ